MGLDNPIHIAFLLILLLLVFGAKRLPEMGKSLGSGLRGFKESIGGEDSHASLVAHQSAAVVAQPVAQPAAVPHAVAIPQPVAVADPIAQPLAEKLPA
jgi:sec-independent protein translocase protein TatA